MAMADLARVYQVHLRTARRWAAQDGWRRTTGRPVTYSLADAQRSYERRHHGRVERHLVSKYGGPCGK